MTFYLLSKDEEDARLCRSKLSEASETFTNCPFSVEEEALFVEVDIMVNRKLIRPSLSDMKEQPPAKYIEGQRKKVPPEGTNAEQYYYLKQMSSKTPMVVKLVDGEEIFGMIEWYDKHCIKVNRDSEPNLLIPKHVIKYIYKESELKDFSGNASFESEIEMQ